MMITTHPALIPILRVITILWDMFIEAYGLQGLVAEKVRVGIVDLLNSSKSFQNTNAKSIQIL
jgi:hypothetical protein